MKRTTYLIIIAAVTIFCIIFGAFINLRYAGRGWKSARKAIRNSFKYEYDYDDYDDDTDLDFDDYDLDDDDDFEDNTTAFDSETLEKFDTISIEGSVLAVEISRGNSYSIGSRYTSNRLKPEFSLKNGRLYIVQHAGKRKMVGNHKCNIKITVPYGVTIDKLDIDLNVGAVQLSGFDVKSASIHTDVGAISVEQLDFDDMYIKSDVGAVAIELLQDSNAYQINANSDLGGITIDGNAVKRRYSQKGTNNKRLRIKTNVGGIEIL